jgi:hypothetical protein
VSGKWDAARARCGRTRNRGADGDACAPVRFPLGCWNSDSLRPHQCEGRTLLRSGKRAPERLPRRSLQKRLLCSGEGRRRCSAPGPDRSEVSGWKQHQRPAAVLLARCRRLSVKANVGKRCCVLPVETVGRSRRVDENRSRRRQVRSARPGGQPGPRDRPIPLLEPLSQWGLVAGVRWSVPGKDAGSARIGNTGATEDAARGRPARPGGSAPHCERGSYVVDSLTCCGAGSRPSLGAATPPEPSSTPTARTRGSIQV